MFGLQESKVQQLAQVTERAEVAEANLEILTESLADLELAMDDRGWQALTTQGDTEFSREGLRKNAKISRVMCIANPLMKRGMNVRIAYIWGQGIGVNVRDEEGGQDVNAVVRTFLDDPGNQAAFTGDQAHETLERALGTDGNVFLALFTNPATGRVQVRSIPFDEVTDIICNPDDRADPWYYERRYTQQVLDANYRVQSVQQVDYYPALNYRPRLMPKTINGYKVHWDTPVKHVKVNALDGWKFGIGDAYASLQWARLYRDFLVDWATLVKALSQFAWKASAGNGSKAAKLRQALGRRPAGPQIPGNPDTVGATAVLGPEVTLEAIPKTGATIDSESGRPLAANVAAGLGIPVTVLLSDPGVTGARATAETLDTPTENEMRMRQAVWGDVYRQVLEYVVLQAVKAAQGPLQGVVTTDQYTGQQVATLAGNEEYSIEIVWQPLDQTPMDVVVKAIVEADSTRKLPPLEIARLLLNALGVKDADEVLDGLTDEDGNWLDPYSSVGTEVANAAIAAYRAGQDPAAALAGAGDPAEDDVA